MSTCALIADAATFMAKVRYVAPVSRRAVPGVISGPEFSEYAGDVSLRPNTGSAATVSAPMHSAGA